MGNWINVNKMDMAENKSLVLQFRGSKQNFSIKNQNFITLEVVKELGRLISPDLNVMSHIDERIKKAKNTSTVFADMFPT